MNKDILKLINFHLNRIKVDYIKAEEKDGVYDSKIGYEVGQNKENKSLFRLKFEVNLKPKNVNKSGYIIESEIMGYFAFPKSFNEEDMQMVVRYNGCTILYGILRGEIANFTGSFPDGKFILPTVNMDEVVRSIIEKEIKIGLKSSKEKSAQNKSASKRVKKVSTVINNK